MRSKVRSIASWLTLVLVGCATPNGDAPALLVADDVALIASPVIATPGIAHGAGAAPADATPAKVASWGWQERSYGDRSGAPKRRRPSARTRDRRNEFSVLIGGRGLDEDETWDPNEDQLAWGIETVIGIWRGLGIELGILAGYSYDEDEPVDDADSTFLSVEGSVGLRYAQEIGRFVPYVGGGLAGIVVYQEINSNDFDDETLAAYVHGGAMFHITDFFAAGVDVRRVFASEVQRFNSAIDTDVDYLQVALRLTFVF